MTEVIFITKAEYGMHMNPGILRLMVKNEDAWKKLWNIGEYYEEEKIKLALDINIVEIKSFEPLEIEPERVKMTYEWYKELRKR